MSSSLFLPEYQEVEVKARAKDYLVGGTRYQRVTTALGIINKPALVPWAKRVTLEKVRAILEDSSVQGELMSMGVAEEAGYPTEYYEWVDRLITSASSRPDEVREATAALGTEIHAIIEELSHIDPADGEDFLTMVPDTQRPALKGAGAFLHDYDIEVVETELTVWDDDVKVCGTMDGMGYRDGHLIIWDWKRSAGLYWEVALQLAAYAHCFTRLTGLRVEEAYGVRLLRETPPEGEPLYEVARVDDLTGAFNAYLSAVHLQRSGNVKWLVKE